MPLYLLSKTVACCPNELDATLLQNESEGPHAVVESKVATLQAIDMGKLEYQQALGKMCMFICKPFTANVVQMYKCSPSAVKNLLHFLSPCFNGRQGPAPDVYDLGSPKR